MSEKPNTDQKSTASDTPAESSLTRRNFLRSSTAGGVGVGLIVTSKTALGQSPKDSALRVALIGCGAQGEALMNATKPIENANGGVKFVAFCDIWKKFKLDPTVNRFRKREQYVEGFTDAEDMFAEMKGKIDAVLIAVPDFVHHKYTRMALEQPGVKGVYCEKMMSNRLDFAADMVRAQRETGKLLQIGHQRRSNPRYLHARNNLIHGNKLAGRVTHAYAQWNRATASSTPVGNPKRLDLAPELLEKYGFSNQFEFRNWRMFKKYAGGAISDLGAHQIDLFNWFYGTTPKSVIASGGVDYHKKPYVDYTYEQADNVMALYEYDMPDGTTSRAYYQVLTTTSSQGFYEKFMGLDGTLTISELDKNGNQIYREASAPSWDEYASQGLVTKSTATGGDIHHKFWENEKPWQRPKKWLASSNVDVRVSKGLDPWELPIQLNLPAHTPHVQNFYETVRKGGSQNELNCPVEEAYRTAVTVLKVNESMATGERYTFKEDDFIVT